MRKPTPSQIKQSEVLGEYFFTPQTMRFYHQRMSDFKTEWYDKEKAIVRLYAGNTERFIDVSSDNWKMIHKSRL